MKLGQFDLHLISDGYFRLDGGAMFGVVPKVLWNRTTECDEQTGFVSPSTGTSSSGMTPNTPWAT